MISGPHSEFLGQPELLGLQGGGGSGQGGRERKERTLNSSLVNTEIYQEQSVFPCLHVSCVH